MIMPRLQRRGSRRGRRRKVTALADTIKVVDTTPRARERNNLTINEAPVGLMRKIVDTAIGLGVDPNAALAAAWKESGLGTIVHPLARDAGMKDYPIRNPMQYNARDVGDKEFNKRINDRLAANPEYTDALQKYKEAEEAWYQNRLQDPEKYKPEVAFQRARIKAMEKSVVQDEYIKGGVNYLKKTIEKKGNLEQGFAKYRGAGQAARYHGKHVMELYDAIKKNVDIQRIVKDGKQRAKGYGMGGS
jgi:hypothetical protein